MSSLKLEACRLLLVACSLKLAACSLLASSQNSVRIIYTTRATRSLGLNPGPEGSSAAWGSYPRSDSSRSKDQLKPAAVLTEHRSGLTDPRSSTIYNTRARAHMLAVYPPTRPGISSTCACVWISFNLLYTTDRNLV